MHNIRKELVVFFSSVLFLSQPVFARNIEDRGNDGYPRITGEILTEYVADTLLKKSDRIRNDDNNTNAYLKVEPSFKLSLNDLWSFNTTWQLRPVEKRVYQGDIWATNHSYITGNNTTDDHYGKENYIKRKYHWNNYGLIIQELTVDFKGEDLAFGIGKFNPSFGKAFDKSKYHGIYGTWMPEEYKLTEKLGTYVSVLFDEAEIKFNLFYDDTTNLSESAFSNRRKDKSTGGAGNTNKPINYSITLEGTYDKFGYNFGFRHLNTKKHYERDEKGVIAGLDYLQEFDTNSLIFIPFAEIAYFDNFNGVAGRDIWYTTASLPLLYKGWNFVVSETYKVDNEPGYKTYRSYLAQISIGYKFKNGLMIDIARKEHKIIEKTDFKTSPQKFTTYQDSWGLSMSYMYKF
jgi:hypothetical protein